MFGRRRTSNTIFVEKSFIFLTIPSRLKLSMKWLCSFRLLGRGSVAFKFWHNSSASLCFVCPIWAKQNSLPSMFTSTAFLSEQTSDRWAGLTRTRSVSLTLLYILLSFSLESKLSIFTLSNLLVGTYKQRFERRLLYDSPFCSHHRHH